MTTHAAHTSLEAAVVDELAAIRDRGLERQLQTIRQRKGAEVTTDRGPAIDFSSNDYLGLASDPRLAAAAAATSQLGTGATASRLIAGNTAEHELLERELSDFLGVESVLTFANGYAANVGTIPALVGRGDVVFADALNHASLIDGARLSRATVHVYPHADVDSLAGLLDQHRAGHRRALVVTDGMFSMDGDLAPLPGIVSLARAHDAWTYVDDAHAIGVTGASGRGTVELQGVLGDVDILVGTLGKAFGAAGAFVGGPAVVRQLLINRARSFVFSTGPIVQQAAAAREAIRIARVEVDRRAAIAENARTLRARLRERGIPSVGDDQAHIVPILVGAADRTMEIGRELATRGILVGAVRPPTVPEGTSRLRLTVSAAHSRQHIDALVDALAEVFSR